MTLAWGWLTDGGRPRISKRVKVPHWECEGLDPLVDAEHIVDDVGRRSTHPSAEGRLAEQHKMARADVNPRVA